MYRKSWFLAAAVAVATALLACGGGAVSTSAPAITAASSSLAPSSAAPSSAAPSSLSPTAEASPSAAAAIVGEWVGVHDCERILSILTEAGLDEFALEAVYGNGLIPGVTTEAGIKDPANPCEGAVQREHSHSFTADGAFGSKDFNGETVDGGTYSLEGGDAIVINSMRFRFQVDGDTLTLQPDPVDISACPDKECRFYATWVLMVAMPGTTWTRGEISPS